jgi:hypothetical protein
MYELNYYFVQFIIHQLMLYTFVRFFQLDFTGGILSSHVL